MDRQPEGAVAEVAAPGERRGEVGQAQPQRVDAAPPHDPTAVADQPRRRGVGRRVAVAHPREQIDPGQVVPQRRLGGGVERDQLLDVDGAGGPAVGKA